MARLDAGRLARQMTEAAGEVLTDSWPEIEEYAKAEFEKIARTILLVETLRKRGKISQREAKLHFRIQRNAAQTVLLTAKGLGLLAAEQAINAALKVVKDTVNTALGFRLI